MATDKTECDEDLKEKFQILKAQLSKHYDGRYFKWLRFCLHGYIPLGDLDRDDVTAMSLFNELQRTGEITPHKVRLLLDIAKLTGFSKAVGQINQYMADNNVQLVDEETLSASREELFHTIRQIGQDELKNVIHNYDELNKFEFTNIWEAVFILDKEELLSTSSNITRFTDCLGKSVQDRRGENREQRPATSCMSNNKQGIQKKDRPNFFSKMKKRIGKRWLKLETEEVSPTSGGRSNEGTPKEVKSETVNVPNASNEEQETQKEFKSETGDIPTTTSNKEQVTQKKVETETEKIQTYLIQIQKDKCSKASIFTPATMREKYKVDISQMFTDMELIKQLENNKGSKPTTLEEMVDIISSTPGCKALIEGEGGIGKTTILRHISYTWATPNKSNNVFEGKIVFLLCVRDLEKDEDIFDLIVKQQDMTDFNLDTDLPKDSRLIKKFIKKHENKVVLLLDGLDELRFNNQSVISIFRKDSFKNSTVILTSRSENIDEFKKECKIHVRVKGFNEESIGKYINKHFEYFENPEMGKSLRRELDMYQGWQRKHEDVYSMCKNPMLLLSICILWEDNQSLPEDKTDLFKEIFRSILNQFHKQQFKDTREKFQKISKFEETPANYVNSMILLGKCMYRSLKENQLSINMKDLKDTQSTTDMIDMAVKLGFVYEEAPISKSNFERMFMSPHKLIVESLVGFYLCKLCESEGIENECTEDVRRILTPLDDNEWEVIKESSYLDLARKFAIGFLGDKAYAFFNHWITNNLSTYRSLPEYLDCVKKPHKDVVINKLINHMESKDLEINNHLDDISTSIRIFIDHISPGVPCDGHFVRLILQLNHLKGEIVQFSSSSGRMAGECKGKVIAHIVVIAECDEVPIIKNLLGDSDAFNHFVTECSLKQVQLALRDLDISGNNLHNIDANSLSSLLIMSPELTWLNMRDCNLSGDVINHLGTECSLKQVQLALRGLTISGNNFHNLDANSLVSLLIMCPELTWLNMRDCNLSGDVINHVGTECSLKQVQLALRDLDISGNNFHNIDVNSLSSFLIMCPKLEGLYMRDCNLSGDVINHLGTECSLKQVQLALRDLDISGNNLHNIDVNSLSSLLIMCPELRLLDMRDCNLSGDVINHLGTECSLKQVQLALFSLLISRNNFHNLDVNSLSSLLIMCPKLRLLDMRDCNLSGDVINHLGTECSLKQVQLALRSLHISKNNFHNLDVNSLSSLLIMCPELEYLYMSDCNLSVDAIKHIDEECSNRNIRFYS